jgi:ubiquinone biosynthesis monooxygenase Coq7
MLSLDRLILEFDKGLRTLAGVPAGHRPYPAEAVPEASLDDAERRHAAALMRINHTGEVCAQALYRGQALGSRNPRLEQTLREAALEEEDHLAWTEQRIRELGGRTSALDPLFYAQSLAIGFAAGRAGDAWNLGFLRETERQVETHLQGHLDRLSPADGRTRRVLEVMQREEVGHAMTAESLGARELPLPVKMLMKVGAKVMTTLTYRV